MFGFNIFEILVILVVAIIFLGPDKLPQLIVDMVKFFKMIKKSINEAKESFDKELQITELKKEALEYKAQFEESMNQHTKDFNLKDIHTDVNQMFAEFNEPKALENPSGMTAQTSPTRKVKPDGSAKAVSFQKKESKKSTPDSTKKTTAKKTTGSKKPVESKTQTLETKKPAKRASQDSIKVTPKKSVKKNSENKN